MSEVIKVSWSKLRTHEECHQKRMLLDKGLKTPIGDVRVYFPGTVTDRLMRRWLDQERPRRGEMASWVDEMLASEEKAAAETGDGVVRWRNRDDRRYVRDFCAEAVARLEPILEAVALPWPYQPAARFQAPMTIPGPQGEPAQIILVGEMDLLVCHSPQVLEVLPPDPAPILIPGRAPDRFRVWDLKTTKNKDYWRKTMGQMTFYSIALMAMGKGLAELVGLIQPMVDQAPVISWVPDQDDLNQMYARIYKLAHDIWAGDDRPKATTEGCDQCPVRHACIRYKKAPGTSRVAFG